MRTVHDDDDDEEEEEDEDEDEDDKLTRHNVPWMAWDGGD